MLKRRYQLLLLASAVLMAFYPALSAEYCSIDDVEVLGRLQQSQGTSFMDVVVPTSGSYYRPVIVASYLFDKRIFGLFPGFMHLENILLHLANAFLVYFLTNLVLPSDKKNKSYLPLIAALLFGLHPVNSESVNWISGRTDLLAGIFVLTSAIYLLKFRTSFHRPYFYLAAAACVLGFLTKEVAFGLIPGALFILTSTREEGGTDLVRVRMAQQLFRKQAIVAMGMVTAGSVFLIIRYHNLAISHSKIGMTLKYINDDLLHSMFVMLRAFCFYIKKMIVAHPLNFAIMEVDPFYQLAGPPLVLLIGYIASRRTLVSAIFITGIFAIAPSFIIAFNQIAWTPYAERYLYVPSAFLIVASVAFLGSKSNAVSVGLIRGVVAAIVLVFAFSTLQRSFTWSNDFNLVKDTVEKSPSSKVMRVVYGRYLIEKREYANATVQLNAARLIPSLSYDENLDILTAYIHYLQGEYDAAEKTCRIVLEKTMGKSKTAVSIMIDLHEIKALSAATKQERRAVERTLFGYHVMLYRLNSDPHILYKLGVLAMNMGERKRAIKLFQQSINNMPKDDRYNVFAQNKIESLTRSMNNHDTFEHL